MNVNFKFDLSDFEKYFKISAVLYACFSILVMILILLVSFSWIGFLLCLPVSSFGILAVLVSMRMLESVAKMDNKAYNFDLIREKYESKQSKIPEHTEPPPNVSFDIVKVQYDPDERQRYKESVRQKGEIIELEVN